MIVLATTVLNQCCYYYFLFAYNLNTLEIYVKVWNYNWMWTDLKFDQHTVSLRPKIYIIGTLRWKIIYARLVNYNPVTHQSSSPSTMLYICSSPLYTLFAHKSKKHAITSNGLHFEFTANYCIIVTIHPNLYWGLDNVT